MRSLLLFMLGGVSLLSAACGAAEEASESIDTETSALAAGTLQNGEALVRGQRLVAKDCYYRLEMQMDGNLVIYAGPGGPAIWATPVSNGDYAMFQNDSNFVMMMLGGTPVWSTNTQSSGASRLSMQNDGNLVMYNGNTPVRSSVTGGSLMSWPCDQAPRTDVTKFIRKVDYPGNDLPGMPIPVFPSGNPDPVVCAKECAKNSSCKGFSMVRRFIPGTVRYQCWLKSALVGAVPASDIDSGVRLPY